MFIGIQGEVSTRDDEENSTVSSQNTENTKEIIYTFMEQELQIQKRSEQNCIPTRSPGREERGKKSCLIIAKFLVTATAKKSYLR